jgi:hypothetical protein
MPHAAYHVVFHPHDWDKSRTHALVCLFVCLHTCGCTCECDSMHVCKIVYGWMDGCMCVFQVPCIQSGGYVTLNIHHVSAHVTSHGSVACIIHTHTHTHTHAHTHTHTHIYILCVCVQVHNIVTCACTLWQFSDGCCCQQRARVCGHPRRESPCVPLNFLRAYIWFNQVHMLNNAHKANASF